jgi:hypothetical protein
VAGSGFQHSKERVIIAEVFLNNMPDLGEDGQNALLALIKDAGSSRELKTRLKNWESSRSSASWIPFKSLFFSKEQTSKLLDEAADQIKYTKDQEFLATLPAKVFQEPLLEQLAQDALAEAHGYFQKLMKRHLQNLHSRAFYIKQQAIYHQVEAKANDQDKKRRISARTDWFNEINTGQPSEDSGYVQYVTRCSDITKYL